MSCQVFSREEARNVVPTIHQSRFARSDHVLRLAAGRPGFLPFVINVVDAFKIQVPEGQQGIAFLDGAFAVFEILDDLPSETLQSGVHTTMLEMLTVRRIIHGIPEDTWRMRREACLEEARRHQEASIVEEVLNLEARRRGFLSFVANIAGGFKLQVPEGQQGLTFLVRLFAVFEVLDVIPSKILEPGIYVIMAGMLTSRRKIAQIHEDAWRTREKAWRHKEAKAHEKLHM